MKEIISIATQNLCDTLGIELESASTLGKGFYGSSIPVFKGKDEYQFYLFFKRDTLKLFANALFFDDDLDNIDLDDLCREIANQIIGKAKNVLNEHEEGAYKLGTPEFLGEVERFNIKLEERAIYKIKNRTFAIGYKKA